jgi:ATP adenylyltransferase
MTSVRRPARAPAARGAGASPRARRPATSARAGAADGMPRLWAPWRMPFIEKAHEPGGCLFCRVAGSSSDRAHLVLARRPGALLMLNRYPYTGGHLMVAVRAHRPSFASLSAAERTDLLDLVGLAERALEAEYRPHGLNLGVNEGRVAGAGFPGHLHVHVVPRWDGDTNFMATVAGTRVLPEALGRTWERLRRAVQRLESAPVHRSRRGAKV